MFQEFQEDNESSHDVMAGGRWIILSDNRTTRTLKSLSLNRADLQAVTARHVRLGP